MPDSPAHTANKKLLKRSARPSVQSKPPSPSLGSRIIEGLEQAIAWSQGQPTNVRVTHVEIPEIDVRQVRTQMGLSQTQFANRFGFPPATLRNWEHHRSRPDRPTRVLLAVIARHPEAVDDVLRSTNLAD